MTPPLKYRIRWIDPTQGYCEAVYEATKLFATEEGELRVCLSTGTVLKWTLHNWTVDCLGVAKPQEVQVQAAGHVALEARVTALEAKVKALDDRTLGSIRLGAQGF